MTNRADKNQTMLTLAQQVAKQLLGTCDSLESEVERFFEAGAFGEDEDPTNNMDFCKELDRLIFCCPSCEWWHAQTENMAKGNEDWICRECKRDQEGDE